jgi:hypothetical protein
VLEVGKVRKREKSENLVNHSGFLRKKFLRKKFLLRVFFSSFFRSRRKFSIREIRFYTMSFGVKINIFFWVFGVKIHRKKRQRESK